MMQEFTQEIKQLTLDMIRDVHVAVPAKIISFDPDKCEGSFQPTAKFRKPDGSQIDYPKIHSVPVYFPQSALQKVTFTYRIEPDDEFILLFLEQALDQWRTGAESKTELRFDLQNCVAIPGLFAKPNQLVKRADEHKSIIIQREDTFAELYDGKLESTVKHKDAGSDTYYLMVDGIADTLEFKVKDLGGKETVSVSIDGNAGQVDVKTTGDINVETEKNISVKAAQNISVESAQNISVEAAQNIDVKAAQNMEAKTAQNITITADAKLDIKSTGAMTLTSADSITLTAPHIDLNP
ncbi:MAG: hypothetical protein LBS84_03245 [Clostridiales bacterium]|jgi:hypothetical protein|nr:hypothetical protein [Clostridiales bacterium]